MKSKYYGVCLAAAIMAAPALAQDAQDHKEHHPPGPAAPTSGSSPGVGQAAPANNAGMMQTMMRNMPAQCRSAMQGVPASCMSMMDKMIQGGMMGGGMMHSGTMQGASSGAQTAQSPPADAHSASGSASLAPHVAAFEAAIGKMHEPMMEGVRHADPDAAFARGMIPHHQAAIDMALVILKYGKDETMRKLALDVIREQNREIAEMNEWLRKNVK